MVQGRVGEILDMLADEDAERVDNILSTIGYDRRTEESRRKEDDGQDESQGSLGENVSGLLPAGRFREGGEGQEVLTEEESLSESRMAGYRRGKVLGNGALRAHVRFSVKVNCGASLCSDATIGQVMEHGEIPLQPCHALSKVQKVRTVRHAGSLTSVDVSSRRDAAD